jgi:hypothetical protein
MNVGKNRGAKIRQGARKKKKTINYINLQNEQPDFRNMPLPEEIQQPQFKYEPLDRDKYSQNRRRMDRANTLSNLHKPYPTPFQSEDSFSNFNFNRPAFEDNASTNQSSLHRNFPSRYAGVGYQEESAWRYGPSQVEEFARFNPHSNNVEKYYVSSKSPSTSSRVNMQHNDLRVEKPRLTQNAAFNDRNDSVIIEQPDINNHEHSGFDIEKLHQQRVSSLGRSSSKSPSVDPITNREIEQRVTETLIKLLK